MNAFLHRFLPGPARANAASKAAALEWLMRREAGLTPALEAEFQHWLNADPSHRAALEALQPGWDRLSVTRRTGPADDLRRSIRTAVKRRRRRRLVTGGASLAAAAVLAVVFVQFQPVTRRADAVPPTAVVRPDRLILPDGSRIELNAGASVVVDYSPASRRVRLVGGEALFHVVADATRPFVVSAGAVAVRAVGTAFAVRFDSGAVDVLVTHGRVAVEPIVPASVPAPDLSPANGFLPEPEEVPMAASPVLVSAGDRMVVPLTNKVFAPAAPHSMSAGELATALAWRNRRVEFTGTSLAEAALLFNRDNAVQLAVADAGTGALRLTGVFWTNDPEAFSRAVALSLGLTVTREGDARIVLRK